MPRKTGEGGGEIVPMSSSPPKRKRMSRKEAMVSTQEGRDLSKTVLGELMLEYNQPKVMSDNQLKQRLNAYLNRCVRTGQYPTIEEGLLSTGYSKQFMLDIAQGRARGRYFTPEASEIIQKFIDIVGAYDAKMVLEGKLPQIPYIFRAKNYQGLSDKTEVQINTGVTSEADMQLDDIAKRYRVETTFADEGAEQKEQKVEQDDASPSS